MARHRKPRVNGVAVRRGSVEPGSSERKGNTDSLRDLFGLRQQHFLNRQNVCSQVRNYIRDAGRAYPPVQALALVDVVSADVENHYSWRSSNEKNLSAIRKRFFSCHSL